MNQEAGGRLPAIFISCSRVLVRPGKGMGMISKNIKTGFAFFLIPAIPAVLLTVGVRLLWQRLAGSNDFSFFAALMIALGLFAAFQHFFKRYFGKSRLLKQLGVCDVPDISGRWVGFLTSSYLRDGQNVVIPITLEIQQDASSVFVRAYFEKAKSDSVLAGFRVIRGRYYLYYVYDNSAGESMDAGGFTDKGVVMLEYFEKDKRMLKGSYFNDVKPQSNYGEIRVSYSSARFLSGGA